MNTPITRMNVSDITIGERRRSDMGDIAGLATSIQEHGLLHPLIVDDNGVLIAGGRRLAAMIKLGFEDVPVRRWQTLGDDDRRIIELEENLQRKDLTAYERSRNLTELAETAAKVDRETGETFRPESGQKLGRPKGSESLGSLARVSERIDTPKQTIHDAQKHVAAAEQYPVLQKPEWRQYQAMEAAEVLNTIPEEDREPLINMLDQPGIPPRTAIETLRKVAARPEAERKQIVALAQSTDERDQSLAITKAAEVPPMPDPRVIPLMSAVDTFKRCIKNYPEDPETEEIRDLMKRVNALIERINERHNSRVESAA